MKQTVVAAFMVTLVQGLTRLGLGWIFIKLGLAMLAILGVLGVVKLAQWARKKLTAIDIRLAEMRGKQPILAVPSPRDLLVIKDQSRAKSDGFQHTE
jgi:hypothetical protein